MIMTASTNKIQYYQVALILLNTSLVSTTMKNKVLWHSKIICIIIERNNKQYREIRVKILMKRKAKVMEWKIIIGAILIQTN